ncbi:MAG: hypothetical protein RL550_1037, partial [Actinomycetota bacterium]
QGGDVVATVSAGIDSTGYGMMINSSRAVLYASDGSDWIDATRRDAEATRDEIRAASTR